MEQDRLDPKDIDIPELIPIEQYDVNEARTKAYLSWILTKAYGKNIPKDFRQPFYWPNNGDEEQLKPSVIKALISSEIYCRTCSALFRDPNTQWKSHMDVMQALSRKGIYVTDPHESAVTDALLQQHAPFKLSCHLSVIEALMTAWTNDLVTIERVVQAVRKFSSFNASSELPFDTEDSLLFWINKVCGTVRHRIGKGEVSLPGADNVMVPVMDDLLKDLSDGCCLAVIISFYCPSTLQLSDIALSDAVGIADSLYNIQIIKQFCQRYIPEKCDHLSVNDLFHTPADLKPSFIVFLAELFSWLEVRKISVSTNVKKSSPTRTITDSDRPSTAKNLTSPSANLPPVHISNATKRSFQQSPSPPDHGATTAGSTPDLQKTGVPVPRQALLQRRPQQGSVDNSQHDREVLHQSVRAWEEPSPGDPRRVPQYSSTQSQLTNVSALGGKSTDSSRTLLCNVSMDSEMSLDFSEASIDISELEETPRQTPIGPIRKARGGLTGPVVAHSGNANARVGGPGQPEQMELESVTPSGASRTGTPHKVGNPHGGNPHGGEPQSGNPKFGNPQNGNLKVGNPHGDNSERLKNGQSMEPLQPANLRQAKEKLNNNQTKQVESGEADEKKSQTTPTKPKSLNVAANVNSIVMAGGDSDGSTPDEDYQTPSVESMPLPGERQQNGALSAKSESAASQQPAKKQFEAFYVNTDSSIASNIPLGDSDRFTPVAESFTLHDHPHTVETARAAGIPIVDLSTGRSHSELSSSESSDPELQKLRADHRARETRGSPRQPPKPRPESLGVHDQPQKQVSKSQESPKTSFAQIKQEKDSGEATSVTFNTNKPGDSGFSLKSQFQKSKSGGKVQKKTTFAALPNQTTWLENAETNARLKDSNLTSGGEDISPTSTELIDIKMRLEERRRQIEKEKRRMEMNWTKERQRLGKQAFIQVINRGKSESDLRQAKYVHEPSSPAKKSVMPADQRLADLIKAQRGEAQEKAQLRTQEKAHLMAKGSSAPASREQSVDREQQLAPPAVKREPVQTHSPRESLTRSVDSAREFINEPETRPEPQPERRPASKQPTPTKQRPKSYHAMEEKPPAKAAVTTSSGTRSQSSTPRQSNSLTSSTDNPNVGNYNNSLDRLNSSLSELQGEIMRLSLQQDQIKCLVVNDREPTSTPQSSTPPPASPPPKPSHSDKYYLYPRGAVGEADVAGTRTETTQISRSSPSQTTTQSTAASVPQQLQHQTQYQPQQHQPHTVPYSGQPQVPYGAVPAYPPQYPQYQPGGMYTVPQPYPPMPQSQYQMASMYPPPPQMYHQVAGYPNLPQSQWAGTSPITHPPHPIQPSSQSPYGNNTFHTPINPQYAQTYTVSSNQTHPHGSGPLTSPPGPSYKSNIDYSDISSSPVARTPPHTSHGAFHSPQSPKPLSTSNVSSPASRDDHWSSSTEEHKQPVDEPSTTDAQPEGFFVEFDDENSPPHPKPNFLRDRRKNTTPVKQRHSRRSPSPPRYSPPEVVDVSPVGFVIGDDETTVPHVSGMNTETDEMEKRRQRLLEQQLKRREDQEKKRIMKEQEMAQKRERREAQQTEAEKKKEEDKKRREAIFQEYLKRKEQDSAEEEPPPPVQKRPQSKSRPKTIRPKSQPPPTGMEDVPPSAVSQLRASQEDLRGQSPTMEIKHTGHVMAFPGGNSNGNGDQTDANYQQLAFGGLTHRRPPTPERPTRLFLDNGSDSSSGPQSQQEYSGPKLFKKPSQKSNRHIIINAISHCCLAGAVNTDVKAKVLDIVNKSEAKHFVIMFRDAGQQFKALYTYDPDKEDVLKIFGVGPKQLTDDMMERFYKYNSGAKSFTEITSTKHLSATIDALCILNALWQKKAPANRRPPNQY